MWSETTHRRPSVWRPGFSSSANASRRSPSFHQKAVPSKYGPMENSFTPNSIPANGPTSIRWSKPSKPRSSSSTERTHWRGAFLFERWTLSACPWTAPNVFGVGRWAFAFSFFGRVKGAWWPSRSSKPLLVRHPPGRGRFDSYPLRPFEFHPAVVAALGRGAGRHGFWKCTATERRGYRKGGDAHDP